MDNTEDNHDLHGFGLIDFLGFIFVILMIWAIL